MDFKLHMNEPGDTLSPELFAAAQLLYKSNVSVMIGWDFKNCENVVATAKGDKLFVVGNIFRYGESK